MIVAVPTVVVTVTTATPALTPLSFTSNKLAYQVPFAVTAKLKLSLKMVVVPWVMVTLKSAVPVALVVVNVQTISPLLFAGIT